MNRQRRYKQNFKSILPKMHLKYHTLIKDFFFFFFKDSILSLIFRIYQIKHEGSQTRNSNQIQYYSLFFDK
jgi:hypothetical protein